VSQTGTLTVVILTTNWKGKRGDLFDQILRLDNGVNDPDFGVSSCDKASRTIDLIVRNRHPGKPFQIGVVGNFVVTLVEYAILTVEALDQVHVRCIDEREQPISDLSEMRFILRDLQAA
jgi:hypothetical protein